MFRNYSERAVKEIYRLAIQALGTEKMAVYMGTIIDKIKMEIISPDFEEYKSQLAGGYGYSWATLYGLLFQTPESGHSGIFEKIQNEIKATLSVGMSDPETKQAAELFSKSAECSSYMCDEVMTWVATQRREMECIYQAKLFLDNHFKQAEASAKKAENWEQSFFDDSQVVGDNKKINRELIKSIIEWDIFINAGNRLSEGQYRSISKLFQAQIEGKREEISSYNHHTRFLYAKAFFADKAERKGRIDEDEPVKDFSPKIEKRSESFSSLNTLWKSKEPAQKQEECAQEKNATPNVTLK